MVRSTNRSGRPGRRLVRFFYPNWWVCLSNPNNPTARPFLSSVEDNRILRIEINAHPTRYRGALGSFMEPGCYKLDGDHPPVRLCQRCRRRTLKDGRFLPGSRAKPHPWHANPPCRERRAASVAKPRCLLRLACLARAFRWKRFPTLRPPSSFIAPSFPFFSWSHPPLPLSLSSYFFPSLF